MPVCPIFLTHHEHPTVFYSVCHLLQVSHTESLARRLLLYLLPASHHICRSLFCPIPPSLIILPHSSVAHCPAPLFQCSPPCPTSTLLAALPHSSAAHCLALLRRCALSCPTLSMLIALPTALLLTALPTPPLLTALPTPPLLNALLLPLSSIRRLLKVADA